MNTLTTLGLALLTTIGSWFGITHTNTQPKALGAFSDPFLSVQLATSPSSGNCLKTDGTNNSWSSSCGSGGGGSGGTWATTTSTQSGILINYPLNNTDVVTIGSNSTTSSKMYFDPNLNTLIIGTAVQPQLSAFATGYYPVQINQSSNDITGINIFNPNTGSQAGSAIFFSNSNTPQGGPGAAGTYYGGLVQVGPNFNGPAVGFGAATPNALALYNTDGQLVLGSATTTGQILLYTGAGSFAGGVPDAILDKTGNFGLATTSPWGRFSIALSGAQTAPLLVISTTTNGTATSTPFIVDKNGNTGIGISNPQTHLHVSNDGAQLSANMFSAASDNFILSNSGGNSYIRIAGASATAGNSPGIFGIRARGTVDTPTVVADQDTLFSLATQGWTGTSRQLTTRILSTVDGAVSTTIPGKMAFDTSTSGGVLTTAMTIDALQRISVGSSSPWAGFSINPIAGQSSNQFVIGSSTGTNFLVTARGFTGVGTSSPQARLAVHPQAGDLNAFSIGSSTKQLLNVSTEGFGTTTLAGLAISATATSTSNVGINLSAGCFAINSTCITGGGATISTSPNSVLVSDAAGTAAIASSAPTVNFLVATSSATSTFVGGIQTKALNVTQTTASSTFANGIIFNGGSIQLVTMPNCNGNFVLETDSSGNLSCGADAGAGAGVTGTGQAGMAAVWSSSSNIISSSTVGAAMFYATSTTASQFPYASTTAITATTASTTNLIVSSILSSLVRTDSTGKLGATTLTSADFPNPLLDSISLNGGNYIIDSGNSYGTPGQILMSKGTAAGDTWVSTTTFSNGLTYSAGNVILDMTNPNVWTGLQIFKSASSTSFSALDAIFVGRTATTTIRGETTATSTFAGGIQGTYLNLTGTAATSTASNGFNISAGCYAIAGTCITGGGGGAVSSVTAADSSLTISPTTGAVLANINLANSNIWTALQQFQKGASSTALSAYNQVAIGNTATTSLRGDSATSTFSYDVAMRSASTTNATSTMDGINLPYGGCVAVRGTCLTANTGTVTSVAMTVPTGMTISGSPVTTSGTLALGVSFPSNSIIGSDAAGTALVATGTGSGGLTASFYRATSTTASVFPYASTTAITVSGTASTSILRIDTLANGCLNITTGLVGTSGNTCGTVTSVATNNGLTGGTITTTGTIGLNVTNLSTNGIVAWDGSNLTATGTTLSLTVPRIIATSTTASSTFASGVQATYISQTGTTATSTFASGINMTGGCYAINSVCIGAGSGSGTVSSGIAGQLGWYSSSGTTISATSTWPLTVGSIISTTTATSTFAGGIQTTALNVTQTAASSTFANGIIINGGNIQLTKMPNCNGTFVVETDSAGNLSCGADASGSGTQTPWAQNIDGATFNLANVGTIGIGTSSPFKGALTVDSGSASTTNTNHIGNVNNFLEVNIQNRSNGDTASGQFTATANNGDDTHYYTEFGINNTGYNQAAFSAQNAGDGFLLANDGALVISSASSTNLLAGLRFSAGGTASSSIRMVMTTLGFTGMGTTTPNAMLEIASTTAPQLTLSSGVTNQKWNFRNVNGILYLATSSPANLNNATSSGPAALQINPTGQGFLFATSTAFDSRDIMTIASTSQVVGNATTTITIQARCFNIPRPSGAWSSTYLNSLGTAWVVEANKCK